MLDVFGFVQGLLKIDRVCIDNNMFQLHYKLTFIILVAFALLVTPRLYIGDPIDCIVDGVPQKIMNSHCWIFSTLTIPHRVGGSIGKDVVQPGVALHVDGEDKVKHHKYYQWVCFVLFFQAMFFYLPRYVWRTCEGGRMKMLVLCLDCPIVSEDCKADRKKLIVDYFTNHLHTQNSYAKQFFLCEFLNLVNVIAQVFFMDYFLEGEFSTYGSDVLWFTEVESHQRECTFNKYGSSGSIQKFDGMCLLPLNDVNKNIYVLLWFWFLIVTVLSGLNLVYRTAVVVMPNFRLVLLKFMCRRSPQNEVETIAKECQIGDWFVLYQLSKNIDPLIFKELVSDLAKRLDSKQSVSD